MLKRIEKIHENLSEIRKSTMLNLESESPSKNEFIRYAKKKNYASPKLRSVSLSNLNVND